jgi:hypothetical protein
LEKLAHALKLTQMRRRGRRRRGEGEEEGEKEEKQAVTRRKSLLKDKKKGIYKTVCFSMLLTNFHQ